MTIKDLARETGYSLGTVSRVLNNHPNVSEQARITIMEAVNRTGFILNTSAKNLKQQHSETIVAVVKGTSNELFAAMVEHIQFLLIDTKYMLIAEFMEEDENEVLRARQICHDKKPKGILFLGGNNLNFNSDFDKINVPCVLVTNSAAELSFDNLSSVSTDDEEAARCAVDYLLDQGHRKIALIGGTPKSDTSRLRYKGWEDAHLARGIKAEECGPYIGGKFSYESGYKAMKQILDREIPVTAVFAMADVMAIGAIRAIHDYGLKVPEDISVMGFDGIQIADYYFPKITTIEQDIEQMAQKACQMIIEHMETDAPARHEMVSFKLNCRESVKRI